MPRKVDPITVKAPETTYRFHGHLPPKAETRTPIVNEKPEPNIEDGVAVLRLYDPIDDWGDDWGVSAKEFGAALDSLPDGVTEIRLHINSPGGQVFDAIAIMNQLRAHSAKVVAVVDGIAASAASFIAASADELIMSKNAELMIHDASGGVLGTADDMRQFADVLDKVSNNIASVYADKSGQPVAYWRQVMKDQSWFSAEEAVEAGLADRVDGDTESVENSFDLSVFNHSGRKDAPTPPIPAAPAPGRLFENHRRRHAMNARRFDLPV